MNRVQIGDFLPANTDAQNLLDQIAANLLFLGRDKRAIAVTSCHDGEGKTTLAVQLAYTLAREGNKVVVVDAASDGSTPFGYNLAEHDENYRKNIPVFATGKYDLSDRCYSTEVSGLFLFPMKAYASANSVSANSKLFSDLLGSLADSFDFIIVDTPSAGQKIDAVTIANACDGIVLVVKYKSTRKKDVREIVHQLEKAGTPILGCIINEVKLDCMASRKRYRFLR